MMNQLKKTNTIQTADTSNLINSIVNYIYIVRLYQKKLKINKIEKKITDHDHNIYIYIYIYICILLLKNLISSRQEILLQDKHKQIQQTRMILLLQ